MKFSTNFFQSFRLQESEELSIPISLPRQASDIQNINLFLYQENYSYKSNYQEIEKIQQEKINEAESTIHYQNFKSSFKKKQQYEEIDIKAIQIQKNKKKSIKKNKKNTSKKAPDYKKNICGYITKKIVKQCLNKQYQHVLIEMCDRFALDYSCFLKVYRNFENITGPTHLYSLVTPRLIGLSYEQQKKQIKAKRIFRIFFVWFLRNRYIRYIMSEGKMQKKDVYIKYKNKELLHLITQQSEQSQINIEKHLVQFNQIFEKEALIPYGQQARRIHEEIYCEVYSQNSIQTNDSQNLQKNQSKNYQNQAQTRKNKEFEVNYIDDRGIEDELFDVFRQKQSPQSKTLSFQEIAFREFDSRIKASTLD